MFAGFKEQSRDVNGGMLMRTAGEGGRVITELPSDPVCYNNSYKMSRHSDGPAQPFLSC